MSKIVGYGEVLWDLLPDGKIAGGAPMNVAYHLTNLGVDTALISQVGADDLGEELVHFLEKNKVNTRFIDRNTQFSTGTVQVQLDKKGSPSYTIVEEVAWDYIDVNEAKMDLVHSADALVFGSLACRSAQSRESLLALAKQANYRVFDVNLRVPFYTQSLLEELLHLADVVKLSDEELAIIGKWHITDADENATLQWLKTKFNITTLLLTKGAEGAICLHEDKRYFQAAFKITVQDTIGSGDAFLAGFLSKMFGADSVNIQEALQFACATGAVVATKKGGTPRIDVEMVEIIIL